MEAKGRGLQDDELGVRIAKFLKKVTNGQMKQHLTSYGAAVLREILKDDLLCRQYDNNGYYWSTTEGKKAVSGQAGFEAAALSILDQIGATELARRHKQAQTQPSMGFKENFEVGTMAAVDKAGSAAHLAMRKARKAEHERKALEEDRTERVEKAYKEERLDPDDAGGKAKEAGVNDAVQGGCHVAEAAPSGAAAALKAERKEAKAERKEAKAEEKKKAKAEKKKKKEEKEAGEEAAKGAEAGEAAKVAEAAEAAKAVAEAAEAARAVVEAPKANTAEGKKVGPKKKKKKEKEADEEAAKGAEAAKETKAAEATATAAPVATPAPAPAPAPRPEEGGEKRKAKKERPPLRPLTNSSGTAPPVPLSAHAPPPSPAPSPAPALSPQVPSPDSPDSPDFAALMALSRLNSEAIRDMPRCGPV